MIAFVNHHLLLIAPLLWGNLPFSLGNDPPTCASSATESVGRALCESQDTPVVVNNTRSQRKQRSELWEALTPEEQRKRTAEGWNKEAWNQNDPTLMSIYVEDEFYWHQLSDKEREYFGRIGYDEDSWNTETDSDDDYEYDATKGGDASARPIVLTDVDVGELNRFNFSFYEQLETTRELRMYDGSATVTDEYFTNVQSLKEYLANMKAGKNELKFNVEEDDVEKEEFLEVGASIQENILRAMIANKDQLLREDGTSMFEEAWQEEDPDFFSWSIWMGGKGTRTPLHFDSDEFNFLYVVEGKKRVVVIPNDHRSEGIISVEKAYYGHSYSSTNVLDPEFILPEGSVDVVVAAGSGIVIPERWWHIVVNEENTIGYGFRVLD